MKWFRFYDEVLDDPKCQRLSPVMFRHWVNILCIANRSNVRGVLPEISDVAFSLRVSQGKAKTILNDLVGVELLDLNPDGSYEPHGWKSRQRVSDDVAKRVAKHRTETVTETEENDESNVTCNVTETAPHARATEADTETDNPHSPPEGDEGESSNITRVSAPKLSAHERRWQKFWSAYPRREGTGAAQAVFDKIKPDDALLDKMLTAIEEFKRTEQWQKDGGQFIPHPRTWLNQKRWNDDIAPAFAGPAGIPLLPGETVVEKGPGYWEMTADGYTRVIKPEYHGVIWDTRIYRGSDGTKAFYAEVERAKAEQGQHEEAA